MGKSESLPTIWEIPDDLWERIEPVILQLDPPKANGRKRVDHRRMLEGVIFRMRSSCQWNRSPKDLGDDSTIHRTFQRWAERGVLGGVWARPDRGMPGVGRRGLGMAVSRLLHWEGAFWGALLDAIPRTGARLGARKAFW